MIRVAVSTRKAFTVEIGGKSRRFWTEAAAYYAIALNGAQMAGLLGIVRAVTAGEIPREAAIELVLASIPSLPRDQAARMIGPEGFEAAAKPVPPAFGAPPPPQDPPPADKPKE